MAQSSDMNILGLTDILMESSASVERPKEEDGEEQPPSLKIPAKKWEYFEIGDHPKAISDKKLLQLKSKYQRRNTEPAVAVSGGPEGDLDIGDLKTKRYRRSSRLQSKSETVEEEEAKPISDESHVEEGQIVSENDQEVWIL